MVHNERKTGKASFFLNRKHNNRSTEHKKLEISRINGQGISQHKQTEIETNIGTNTITCITETQHKYMKVNISDSIEHTLTQKRK